MLALQVSIITGNDGSLDREAMTKEFNSKMESLHWVCKAHVEAPEVATQEDKETEAVFDKLTGGSTKSSANHLWGTRKSVYEEYMKDPNRSQWHIGMDVGCSQPNVSYHIRALRREGLID